MLNVEDFQILSGADELVTYESSKGKYRYYCKNYHSQIYHIKDDMPDKVTLKLETIDRCEQDLTLLERKHIHNSQKFPWLEWLQQNGSETNKISSEDFIHEPKN